MDSIACYTDIRARREVIAVDGKATRQHLPREDTADAGRETHSFVDAGTEVSARRELRASVNLFDVGECAPDFPLNESEGTWVI